MFFIKILAELNRSRNLHSFFLAKVNTFSDLCLYYFYKCNKFLYLLMFVA